MKSGIAVDGQLRQDPVDEINQLREGTAVEAAVLEVSSSAAVAIPGTESQALDVSLTLESDSSSACGVLLRSWMRPSQEEGVIDTQALLIDWDKSTLEVGP